MIFIPISDIHNEFEPMDYTIYTDNTNDILVIAGDFFVAGHWPRLIELIRPLSERFREVIYVLGNHDYWGGSFVSTLGRFKQELSIFGNVHVLEKDCVVFDGVAFVCATLWTDFSNHNQMVKWDAQRNMRDYKKIRNGTTIEPYKKKLFASDIEMDHVNAKHYIKAEVLKQKELGHKVVVVTHHGPSAKSRMSTVSITNEYNPMYYSNMDLLVEELSPEYWIHGHTHESKFYTIGTTQVIVNPRGYAPDDLNEEFDPVLLCTV